MESQVRVAVGLVAAMLCPSAMAHEAGDWITRLGMHYVEPKHHNNDVVGVDGAAAVTGSVSYFFTDSLALDLLLAIPFEHDITLNASGDEVGSTQHLPPTLSLMWYPDIAESWHPFLGAGINYTTFFQEETKSALDGTKLRLDDSFGAAFAVGVDVDLTESLALTLDVRYMDIDTEAHLDGASLGDVKIDPFGFGLSFAYRF